MDLFVAFVASLAVVTLSMIGCLIAAPLSGFGMLVCIGVIAINTVITVYIANKEGEYKDYCRSLR